MTFATQGAWPGAGCAPMIVATNYSSEAIMNFIQRWQQARQIKRERMGDSPEKLAERHEPKRDWIDRWVWSCGVERQSRF